MIKNIHSHPTFGILSKDKNDEIEILKKYNDYLFDGKILEINVNTIYQELGGFIEVVNIVDQFDDNSQYGEQIKKLKELKKELKNLYENFCLIDKKR